MNNVNNINADFSIRKFLLERKLLKEPIIYSNLEYSDNEGNSRFMGMVQGNYIIVCSLTCESSMKNYMSPVYIIDSRGKAISLAPDVTSAVAQCNNKGSFIIHTSYFFDGLTLSDIAYLESRKESVTNLTDVDKDFSNLISFINYVHEKYLSFYYGYYCNKNMKTVGKEPIDEVPCFVNDVIDYVYSYVEMAKDDGRFVVGAESLKMYLKQQYRYKVNSSISSFYDDFWDAFDASYLNNVISLYMKKNGAAGMISNNGSLLPPFKALDSFLRKFDNEELLRYQDKDAYNKMIATIDSFGLNDNYSICVIGFIVYVSSRDDGITIAFNQYGDLILDLCYLPYPLDIYSFCSWLEIIKDIGNNREQQYEKSGNSLRFLELNMLLAKICKRFDNLYDETLYISIVLGIRNVEQYVYGELSNNREPSIFVVAEKLGLNEDTDFSCKNYVEGIKQMIDVYSRRFERLVSLGVFNNGDDGSSASNLDGARVLKFPSCCPASLAGMNDSDE